MAFTSEKLGSLAGRSVDLLLSAGVFVGALLLFQVQPMIGKYILPWFGGSPSVWTTCLLFFQVFLLAGYLYAHLLVMHFGPRAQAVIHVVLAAATLVTLPVIPSDRWKPSAESEPVWHIFALLISTLGLPYLILSATGPLLQSWFGRVRPGRSPYRLYALSNVASLLALLSYPISFEPMFSRRSQAVIWSGGFVVYVIVLAISALKLRSVTSGAIEALPRAGPAKWSIRLLWISLPACATTLLMAFTNTLCQEVAAVPFLWVVPLSVYLLTFIICFDSPRWYHRGVFVPLTFLTIGMLCWVIFIPADAVGLIVQVATYSGALFVCCMACHGELFRLRPHAGALTGYYLHVAAGGAVGGLFVAVIAPLLFGSFLELPIGLAFTVALVLVVLYADPASPMHRGANARRWRFALGGAILIGIGLGAGANRFIAGTEIVERTRNFHGVLTVYSRSLGGTGRQLLFHHGGISHGLQFTDPNLRRMPTAYYGPTSGIGRMLDVMSPMPRKIGLVGQGVGTLAAYGREGDAFRSYELNAEADRLARQYFTFIADCAAHFTTIIGDARLTLEREPDQQFDLLALDAFSGDAIPVHLLTSEAFDLYTRQLKVNGVIAVHISNQHLDLSPVVFAQAERIGMSRVEMIDPGDDVAGRHASNWILMSRDPSLITAETIVRVSRPIGQQSTARILWTDDHTSLLPLLR